MSKLFERIYQTAKLADKYKPMDRLNVKGYKLVILGNDADKELPDIQGPPPKGYETYGRCGIHRNGDLFMTGGTNGDFEGHPPTLKWGGYWGTKIITDKNRHEAGLVFVRGRAVISDSEIEKVSIPIIDWISKKIPKV
jgi:hypothetical protein